MIKFRVTPLILASTVFASVPYAGAAENRRPSAPASACVLLAANIGALTFACGTGNAAACLALAIAVEKFNRECEGSPPPIPPSQGGPTMRPR